MNSNVWIAAVAMLIGDAPALAQEVRVIVSGEVAPGVYGRVDISKGPRRVAELNGDLTLTSSTAGTELLITLPQAHA